MGKLNTLLVAARQTSFSDSAFLLIDDESRGLVAGGSKCEGFPISRKAGERILELETQILELELRLEELS
ncbi:MAG: hypothetical protein DRQ48_01925 [Gammaproteobacteria bacterium]|nr:MAG: hypothetical protein DRQ48_01925 [Gammaproteobacteria bacterium]